MYDTEYALLLLCLKTEGNNCTNTCVWYMSHNQLSNGEQIAIKNSPKVLLFISTETTTYTGSKITPQDQSKFSYTKQCFFLHGHHHQLYSKNNAFYLFYTETMTDTGSEIHRWIRASFHLQNNVFFLHSHCHWLLERKTRK